MAKSNELGGQRSGVRHASEIGIGGALALLIVSFLPDAWIDPFQSNLISVVLTATFSTAAKLLQQKGILGILGKAGLVVLVTTSMGCAVFAGSSKPYEFTGVQGETIVACEIKGIALTFGDADICRNVEGGHISEPFAGVLSGLFDAVLRIIGGIFTGIGGVGAAISPGASE